MEKKSVREKIEEICNGRLPSLMEVATKMGFKKDPNECSQRSVCMRIGQAGGGEKILIYDGGKKYKNLRSGNSGDVVAMSIEFMDRFCNRSYDWKAFYQEWQDYYGSLRTMAPEQRNAINAYGETKAFVPFVPSRWEIKPFGPTSNTALKTYMQYTRCIDRDTLAETCGFFNTIKDTKFGTHNGRDIVNIGFPLRRLGETEPCGFEIKNINYKRTAPGSDVTNGMWMATRAPLDKVERILFFESAIDAISYVSVDRLRAKEAGTERSVNLDKDLLVSCSGGPKLGQIVALKNACPQAKAVGAFDLDQAGHKDDIVLNNVWSGQVMQFNNVNKRDEEVFPATFLSNPDIQAKINKLRDEGWATYLRKDGATVMYKSNTIAFELKFNGQSAVIPKDELTLPKVANAFKDYRIVIDREKPLRGEFTKVVNGKEVKMQVKDWNDRAIADKQERRAGLQRSIEKVGVIRQKQQEREASEQARRDEQIAKANERLANKGVKR